MAKRFETEMFGLNVIQRHDYEDSEIKHKINSYRKKSVEALTQFLTNVPGSDSFTSFLDIGCGDAHDMSYFKELNPKYEEVYGIDLYIEEESNHIFKEDWYDINSVDYSEVIYINHSMEHAANIYALMEEVASLQVTGDVLFVAVPDGNSPFGYSITSSTTHFSVITEGFLSTTLQRFGYNVAVETREFREGSPEIWAFAVKS